MESLGTISKSKITTTVAFQEKMFCTTWQKYESVFDSNWYLNKSALYCRRWESQRSTLNVTIISLDCDHGSKVAVKWDDDRMLVL